MKRSNAILTHVDTDHQLADVLTKPTSASVKDKIYPLRGLDPQKWMREISRERPTMIMTDCDGLLQEKE